MTGFSAGRHLAAMLLTVGLFHAGPAAAGEVSDQATLAEDLIDRGYDSAALAAFDRAAAAFWNASPMQLRTILFFDEADGFAQYTPRDGSVFAVGETMKVYLEPFGFTYAADGDGVKGGIALDLKIQTPGGLILATAEDFGALSWQARVPVHEVHGTIELAVPELKPGSYQMILTLRDEGSDKTAETTLAFSIDGPMEGASPGE